jgi:type VI secretion system protein ImpH
VFFYIGHELDWDLELALPVREIRPVSLGRFGRLGYTSWMGSGADRGSDAYRCDARFHPAERLARSRQAAA